jgi:formylglycine-generating enzyme required for sulfatase activity
VIHVSWHDANEYARWLSHKTGKNYRLPTEAQWEFAARAGKKTAYVWGNQIHCGLANYGSLSKYCKTDRTKPVASYKAYNGLYDMQGNVHEWTCSAYDRNYAGKEGQCTTRKDTRSRVLRGGSWDDGPRLVRSAARDHYTASIHFYDIGFRLSRTR